MRAFYPPVYVIAFWLRRQPLLPIRYGQVNGRFIFRLISHIV